MHGSPPQAGVLLSLLLLLLLLLLGLQVGRANLLKGGLAVVSLKRELRVVRGISTSPIFPI